MPESAPQVQVLSHQSNEVARFRHLLELIRRERLAKLVLDVHDDVDLCERVPALIASQLRVASEVWPRETVTQTSQELLLVQASGLQRIRFAPHE